MATGTGAYHLQVAQEKRTAILGAATSLFADQGYAGTSLARVAEVAGVSRATLFKQFPTKAALFEAIVAEHWHVADGDTEEPAPGDLVAGLLAYGRRYAALMSRPQMVGLHRIVVAELPRFPDLAEAQFTVGKMPFFDAVRRYLTAEHEAGNARVDDPVMATTQFLGMIANFVLWPQLIVAGWSVTDAQVEHAVAEAVETAVARYGAP